MGLAARLPPDPDGEGPRGTYPFGPPGLAGLPRPGPMLEKALGRSRLQGVGGAVRPGLHGMVPWGHGQGHSQPWPELCLPRSDGAVVTPQTSVASPSTGLFLPCRVHHGQGEPPGQLASHGGQPGPLRLEAVPSGMWPRGPRWGAEPTEVPVPLLGLGPHAASLLLPATAPTRPHGAA